MSNKKYKRCGFNQLEFTYWIHPTLSRSYCIGFYFTVPFQCSLITVDDVDECAVHVCLFVRL